MKYQEIQPGIKLRPYVKNYYLFEAEDKMNFDDTVFPGGNMEIIFNLGDGIWKTESDTGFVTTPAVELWGQITKPLLVQSVGKNKMLGIRFFPHSAAFFLNEEICEFNDQVTDLRDLLGSPVRKLHEQLAHLDLSRSAELLDLFLEKRLIAREKKIARISMVGAIAGEMRKSFLGYSVESFASKYGMTPRYLQKLFLQCTGVTPKLYGKINRFQQSLRLLHTRRDSLTSIAYDCGYFDQSHFIREFKTFTGITPSAYALEQYPVSQLFATA